MDYMLRDVPSGHLIYETSREGEAVTFTVCDNVPNECPEYHPETGELINIFYEDSGLIHMLTCDDCIEWVKAKDDEKDDYDQQC